MSKSVISFHLAGKPDERILLRFVAKRFNCEISPREHKGAENVVQGKIDDLVKVRATFNYLRTTALLRQAVVVAEYTGLWGINPLKVETAFMTAFVNRICEHLDPSRERPYVLDTEYAVAGYNFAEELFKESEDEWLMTTSETNSI